MEDGQSLTHGSNNDKDNNNDNNDKDESKDEAMGGKRHNVSVVHSGKSKELMHLEMSLIRNPRKASSKFHVQHVRIPADPGQVTGARTELLLALRTFFSSLNDACQEETTEKKYQLSIR
ncbi:hypothetical protein EYF80_054801 [Liparis tanakae]|uniref:Uncharacterized protein n=1 Tax=Liparis tanakae TaxID=230148 RepID=A0A4Z2F2X1_9TELE|nr:hypothetical protein EYF80_054801 [Liparis tanakae]